MNAATFYIALIHKDADSDFGVSFPDFPGCVSAGETLAQAAAMGREALEGHVALMIDEGEAIPNRHRWMRSSPIPTTATARRR